jgi:dCMP deaminase
MARLSWEHYAMALADTAKRRSEDPWVQVGACTLRYNNTVAATGYNGAPSGIAIDWSDRDNRRKYVIHAERNCLNYAGPGECRLIACTLLPCPDCIKEIAIKEIPVVLYQNLYFTDSKLAEESFELAKFYGIDLQQLTLE